SSDTYMNTMLRSAGIFNQDSSGWDTSNVIDMSSICRSATAFNQDISAWDTSNVTDMASMFVSAAAFNQDIGGWDISGVTTMGGMLDGASLSVGNYDATLSGWAAQTVQSGVTLGANGLQYSLSVSDRQSLIDDDGWIITGDSFVGNTVPVAADNTITTNEDTAHTFTAAEFNYSDGDGHVMASVKITTLEAVGALQLSGADVTLDQVVTKADIDVGSLKFVPADHGNGTGYDSFGFSVNDGTDDSASAYTMTIDVTATNDDPTNAGSLPTDISVNEDVSGNVNLSAINLSDVDAASGSLTMTLTTSTGGNLTAAAGTGITLGGSGSGVLTLDGTQTDLNNYLNTASNITYLHGTPGTSGEDADTIQINVNDNGNTGSGGGTDIDFGTTNIDIDATNDAPVNTVPGTQTIAEETTTAISGISIADSDAGGANLTTRLQASAGVVNVTLSGSATISSGANGSG
ncbi:MAG: DUF285 domain-containing protein, partial [Sulfitobacter sp.]|nr:DUF285 domain-containing protein [Sulfitobacter sp.]